MHNASRNITSGNDYCIGILLPACTTHGMEFKNLPKAWSIYIFVCRQVRIRTKNQPSSDPLKALPSTNFGRGDDATALSRRPSKKWMLTGKSSFRYKFCIYKQNYFFDGLITTEKSYCLKTV